MSPEEHIEMAETIISNYANESAVKAAEVHVRIAEFKKKYPPENVRPISRAGRRPCPPHPLP